jgi:hypothetical protein
MKLIDKQLLNDVSRQAQKSDRLRMNSEYAHEKGSMEYRCLWVHGTQ